MIIMKKFIIILIVLSWMSCKIQALVIVNLDDNNTMEQELQVNHNKTKQNNNNDNNNINTIIVERKTKKTKKKKTKKKKNNNKTISTGITSTGTSTKTTTMSEEQTQNFATTAEQENNNNNNNNNNNPFNSLQSGIQSNPYFFPQSASSPKTPNTNTNPFGTIPNTSPTPPFSSSSPKFSPTVNQPPPPPPPPPRFTNEPTMLPQSSPSISPSQSPSKRPSSSSGSTSVNTQVDSAGWIGCTEDGGDRTKFDICLDISPSSNDDDNNNNNEWIHDIISAKERWESIIIGDIPSGTVPTHLTSKIPICSGGLPNIIDDLYICLSTPSIDGPGGVLAGAGSVLRRLGSNLPITGVMIFDSVDMIQSQARGTFERIVLHEMGHVFGIGVLFQSMNLINPISGNYRHNTFASYEWEALGCLTELPIERDFGPGTAGAHWDEFCLDHELMTGIAEADGSESLSRITVASLRDMGYQVNMDMADAYSKSDVAPTCCSYNDGDDSDRLRKNKLRTRTRTRRRMIESTKGQSFLSPEGLAKATEFGRKELTKLNNSLLTSTTTRQRRRGRNLKDSSGTMSKEEEEEEDNDDYIVGVPYYSVLYLENNQIHSVIIEQ